MRRKKEVTMQAIAERLNVSKVTVSKALNDKEGVSEELKVKIKQVAEELGYKILNSEPAQEVPRNIAIIVKERYVNTSDYVTFYLKFYQKLAVSLNAKGYICNLFTLNDSKQKGKELPKLFLDNHISGVVIMGDINKEYIQAIKSLSIPMIFLDFYDSENNIDCILTDSYHSSYALTNHLLQNGHKEIGFVGNIRSTSSIQDRFLGYYRSLLEAGIPMNEEWIIPDRGDEGEKVDFRLPERVPTAFVCNCDSTAYQFIEFLKRAGYRVPEDISIVGFDNDIYAEICSPKLTTIAVNMETMTRKTTEMIISKLEHRVEDKQTKIFVTGDIIYRDSVKKIS